MPGVAAGQDGASAITHPVIPMIPVIKEEATSMEFRDPPATAAWQHIKARSGFEVVCFTPIVDEPDNEGWRIHGCTTAFEDGRAWIVHYVLELSLGWALRTAHLSAHSAAGRRAASLITDGHGHWQLDGRVAPDLDGCHDLALASSAMTAALPVRRLALADGARADAPAAYVRAADLAVERLGRSYELTRDKAGRQRYEYKAPGVIGDGGRLVVDSAGLLRDYPGLAIRVT